MRDELPGDLLFAISDTCNLKAGTLASNRKGLRMSHSESHLLK
jgi:hypothetical protein